MSNDFKDDDESLDYLAENLFPGFYHSREVLAERIMKAMYKDEWELMTFHPDAFNILEQLSIRLMGKTWCKEWIEANGYAEAGDK